MKRLCLSFALCFFLFNNITAQPQSIEYYKENDFLLNVLCNPSFCLEDFRDVGLTSKNTELRSMSEYVNTKNSYFHSIMIKAVGKDNYETRKMVYNKVAASWKVFKEIQYSGGTCRSGSPYNVFDTRYKETEPELRHKLSIVPLKLVKY